MVIVLIIVAVLASKYPAMASKEVEDDIVVSQIITVEPPILENTEYSAESPAQTLVEEVPVAPPVDAPVDPIIEVPKALIEKFNYDKELVRLIENPSAINVLVNKLNELPKDYVPEDLIVPDVKFSFSGDNPKKYLRAEAAEALEKMFSEASEEGHHIFAVSGYRSYEKQSSLYSNYVSQYGKDSADRFSAQPGKSEHQLGLVMDVSSASVGYDLVAAFGESEEGKWLENSAHRFGFILRYPSGKTDITGYMYEPWHFRYVGTELALEIFNSKLTLEEYYEDY